MIRTGLVEATVCFYVDLPLPDDYDEENAPETADPEGHITDAEAFEYAASMAIKDNLEVFVFGQDYKPAIVSLDSVDYDINGEGDYDE